jgi:hypothetical protein
MRCAFHSVDLLLCVDAQMRLGFALSVMSSCAQLEQGSYVGTAACITQALGMRILL